MGQELPRVFIALFIVTYMVFFSWASYEAAKKRKIGNHGVWNYVGAVLGPLTLLLIWGISCVKGRK
jgi:hypothetical protein